MSLANLASKGVGMISPLKKGHSRSRSFDFSNPQLDMIQQSPVISPPASPRAENSVIGSTSASTAVSSVGQPSIGVVPSAPAVMHQHQDQSAAVKGALLKKKRRGEHQRNYSVASVDDIHAALMADGETPPLEASPTASEGIFKRNPVNRLGRNISSAFFNKKEKKLSPVITENPSDYDEPQEESEEDESIDSKVRGIFKAVKAAAGVVSKNKTTHLIELEPHDTPIDVPLLPTDTDVPAAVRMRNKVINEIILTERDYLQDLQYLNKNFRDPMTKLQILNHRESSALFSNVSLLIGVNKELLDHLQKEVASGSPMIGSSFISIADYLKMYSVYCNNQQNSADMKKNLSENNANFRQWMLQRFPTLDVGVYALSSYLIKPVQRVCKYPLLLRELLKHTARDHGDFGNLEAAFIRIEQVVGTINQSSVVQGDIFKLAQLQARFLEGEKLGLMTPTRRYKDEALFKEVNEKEDSLVSVYYFLFNDLVLKAVNLKRHTITKLTTAPAGNLKVKSMMQLSKVTTSEVESHPLLSDPTHLTCSFTLLYGDSKTVLVADSVEEKDKWVSGISELKAQLKKKTTLSSDAVPSDATKAPPPAARSSSMEGLFAKPRASTLTEAKGSVPNSRIEELRQLALKMREKLADPSTSESPLSPRETESDDWAPPPIPPQSVDLQEKEKLEPEVPVVLLPRPLRICIRLSTESDDCFHNVYLEAKHMQTLKEKIAAKYGKHTIKEIAKNDFQRGGVVILNQNEIQHLECDDEVIVTLS